MCSFGTNVTLYHFLLINILVNCIQISTAFSDIGSSGLFGVVFGFQKLCLCRCGVAHTQLENFRNGRLLGGESISPHQFPWLAVVYTGSQKLGGSLISDRHVITAASPLYGLSSGHITVELGAHDRCGIRGDPSLNSSIEAVLIHPEYSPTNGNHNLCLLKLRHVVAFSRFVSPICLPFYGQRLSGKLAWTVGWGENATSSCTPRTATFPILSYHSCLMGGSDNKLVTRDKGCLGPLGSKSLLCKGDVGAPVMSQWASTFRLIGVLAQAPECDQPFTPLYTKTIDHLAWIHNHIRNDCQCL